MYHVSHLCLSVITSSMSLTALPNSSSGLLGGSNEHNYLETLKHDANMGHFYKWDPMLWTRATAIYWVPSSLKLFDEIKGNIFWLEGLSATISQIHTHPKRVSPVLEPEPEHKELDVPGITPKPQESGKRKEIWIIWDSWPHFQIYRIGKILHYW